jgi:hypothetical protein
MWAGVFSVPPLISWYLDHFPAVHAQLPVWTGTVSLTAGVGLAIVALIANAVSHARLDRILTRENDAPRRDLSLAPKASDERRIFVDLTPDQLTAMCEGHTSAVATTLTQPFIGKWLKITGTIKDVVVHYSIVRVLLQLITQENTRSSIDLNFDREWEDQLTVLIFGSRINVIGKIQSISKNGLYLEKCELVPIDAQK